MALMRPPYGFRLLLLLLDALDQNSTRSLWMMILINAEVSRVDPDLVARGVTRQSHHQVPRTMSMVTQVHVHTMHQKHYWNEDVTVGVDTGDEFYAHRTDGTI